MISTVARYSLREARHHRLAGLALGLLLVAFVVVEFVGAIALTERHAIQGTLFASLLRLGAVLLLGLFVVASLLREQQDRTVDLLLALDAPRAHYVLGKLISFGVIAAALALVFGLATLIYAAPLAALRWTLSLFCELALVAALATLLAFTFRQVVAALAALGAVYVAARAMGGFQLLLADPVGARHGLGQQVIDGFIGMLAWILPSLWRFTDAAWIARGTGDWADLGLIVGQTLIYLVLLVAAALFDFYRRAF